MPAKQKYSVGSSIIGMGFNIDSVGGLYVRDRNGTILTILNGGGIYTHELEVNGIHYENVEAIDIEAGDTKEMDNFLRGFAINDK